MKFKLLKLWRYGVIFPLDLLKSLPFLLVCFVFPTNNAETLAKRLLVLFLHKKPTAERVKNLAHILNLTNYCNWKCVLTFFMWPEKIETKIFRGWSNLQMHHKARLLLINQHLPASKYLIDLGGSGGGIPGGGLMHMGYPCKPKKITIVDLPPQDQFWKHKDPLPNAHPFIDTEVHYLYSGMDNLQTIESDSIDMVWAGQSIEHVPMAVAQKTIQEAFRVLKPAGYFCLDTPNRKLTKFIARAGYVHPEHFYEYEPDELAEICEKNGFKVIEKKSITPMPFSADIKHFCKLEVKQNIEIGNNPDNGYSFYLKLMKPI